MKKRQSGQALLIILLIMAVALTVGLSVVSRSITDIRISHQEEESARAFSAAEAGIEKALTEGMSGGAGVYNFPDIDVKVIEVPQGGEGNYDFQKGKFKEGEIQSLWLVGHNDAGEIDTGVVFNGTRIDFYWGNESEAFSCSENTPALEATLIYKEGLSSFKVLKKIYDPCPVIRSPSPGFDPGIYQGSPYQFKSQTPMDLVSGTTPYLLRLKFLYNGSEAHSLKVEGDGTFPAQGNCYVSTATVPESGVTRKIEQCQGYSVPPGFFDYVLFSETNLTK